MPSPGQCPIFDFSIGLRRRRIEHETEAPARETLQRPSLALRANSTQRTKTQRTKADCPAY
jgi:hypothetical protein